SPVMVSGLSASLLSRLSGACAKRSSRLRSAVVRDRVCPLGAIKAQPLLVRRQLPVFGAATDSVLGGLPAAASVAGIVGVAACSALAACRASGSRRISACNVAASSSVLV